MNNDERQERQRGEGRGKPPDKPGSARQEESAAAFPDAVEQHLAECDCCGGSAVDLSKLRGFLEQEPLRRPPIDAPALSRKALEANRRKLESLRTRCYRRRIFGGLAAALVPLPLVLFYDAYILGRLYEFLAYFMPHGLAFYLIAGQSALLALLFSLTYASLPLLAERTAAAAEHRSLAAAG